MSVGSIKPLAYITASVSITELAYLLSSVSSELLLKYSAVKNFSAYDGTTSVTNEYKSVLVLKSPSIDLVKNVGNVVTIFSKNSNPHTSLGPTPGKKPLAVTKLSADKKPAGLTRTPCCRKSSPKKFFCITPNGSG